MGEVGMAVQKSIIPTTLVRILFCTAIPTSPINFIQLFFMLVTVLFLLPFGVNPDIATFFYAFFQQ